MTNLLFSKELAMSLRVLFDLAFGASFLAVRWITSLIADGRVIQDLKFQRAKSRGPTWSGAFLAIDAENMR